MASGRRRSRNSGHHQNGERNPSRRDELGGGADASIGVAGSLVSHATEAFGAKLIDKPLMQNVVADLEVETEVGTAMVMRLAGAYERGPIDDHEAAFGRLGLAVAKYWLTKRSSPVVREALECVGGNGYVEESILGGSTAVPLNSIWEGAGNVIALDVLRACSVRPMQVRHLSTRSLLPRAPIELSTEKLLVCARRLRLR